MMNKSLSNVVSKGSKHVDPGKGEELYVHLHLPRGGEEGMRGCFGIVFVWGTPEGCRTLNNLLM